MGPIETYAKYSDYLMDSLELVAALVLVLLFGIGVFDLGLQITRLVASGGITHTENVIGLIDDVLLLFIIVEIYQTVIAYAREQSVIRLVLATGMIAIARKMIIHHHGDFETVLDSFLVGVTNAVMLLALAGSFYILLRYSDRTAPT